MQHYVKFYEQKWHYTVSWLAGLLSFIVLPLASPGSNLPLPWYLQFRAYSQRKKVGGQPQYEGKKRLKGKWKAWIFFQSRLQIFYFMRWERTYRKVFPCCCDRSPFLIWRSQPSSLSSNCLIWHLSWPIFTLAFLAKVTKAKEDRSLINALMMKNKSSIPLALGMNICIVCWTLWCNSQWKFFSIFISFLRCIL